VANLLTLNGVDQYYGESHTLWNLNLAIEEGSITCLMGRNGVGKSTLLKSVMGLEKIRNGSMTFRQHELSKLTAETRATLKIGYVPQGREIFSQLSIIENLETGLISSGSKKLPDIIFELFPVLKEMQNRRGGDLSGGQQQQLAIGRALAIEPELLILDEPTEGIQPNIVREIGYIIIRLNQELGLTVLLVEQKLPFARRVGSHFCIMEKGRNVAADSIEKLNDELIDRYLKV